MTYHRRGGQARTGLLIVALLAFVGLIALSVIAVRYRVDGAPATEPRITRDSLTHEVQRGPDGSLTRGGEVADPGAADATPAPPPPDTAQPCPT